MTVEQPPNPTAQPELMVDIGDRVILASAHDRARTSLGTVIARDPHPDRDVLVQVLHEDGVPRWRRRDALRSLGHRMSVTDLAADLESMGLGDLAARVINGGAS